MLFTSALVGAQDLHAPAIAPAAPANTSADAVAPSIAPSTTSVPPATVASSATATSPAPMPPTAEQPATSSTSAPAAARHGFFMRMQLGGGYRAASGGTGSTAVDVSGTGLGLSFLAGGSLAENLFLYGEVLMEQTTNPTIEIANQSKRVAKNAASRLVGFGYN
jgi:hypothetical protein